MGKGCFIAYLILIPILSCKHEKRQNKETQTTTLINARKHPKDTSTLFNDSIQLKYTQLDSNTQNVSRIFFLNKGKPVVMEYTLIKCGDSLVYIKPLNDTIKSVYLNTKSAHSTHLYFNIPQVYLMGGLRYIRTENCLDKNKAADQVMVFYGNDIGFSFGDSLYYYFDKKIHLRKIASKSGEIMYVDKDIFL